jgi:hypothetical protein
MPLEVAEPIVQFLAQHHVERPFMKRRRQPADLLTRRGDEKVKRQ